MDCARKGKSVMVRTGTHKRSKALAPRQNSAQAPQLINSSDEDEQPHCPEEQSQDPNEQLRHQDIKMAASSATPDMNLRELHLADLRADPKIYGHLSPDWTVDFIIKRFLRSNDSFNRIVSYIARILDTLGFR